MFKSLIFILMKILIKTVRYGKNVLFYRADFDQNVNQKIKIFY